jgi:hypothetical protein
MATRERGHRPRVRVMLGLLAGIALVALVGLAATAQAATKFGADLRNSNGSVTQPTGNRTCQDDANPLDASKQCDRVAVQYLDTGSPGGHRKAPKTGTIVKLKLVALAKGHFRFELAKAKNLHGSNGKAKIVDRGRRIDYKSSIHGNDYKIQTFHVHQHVGKNQYLAIKSRKTSLLKCQSGSTEQLLFQPPLPVGGPFESNLGHRSNCTLLLQAVYKRG